MMFEEVINDSGGQIKVNFGYQSNYEDEKSSRINIPTGTKLKRANSSFSCLSGAAISANCTLANTNICNGLLGAEILPSLDSPNSFRRIPSSPSVSRLDLLSSSLQSSMSILSCSPSSPNDESDSFSLNCGINPSRNENFELQVAGGAAGEDRVQAVCSEENDWLFCAVYDGFNGRDAADFLAGTLYETVAQHLGLLDFEVKQQVLDSLGNSLIQAENDFLHMVEQEMEDRPDLVSIGSCVLITLLHGKDLYVVNVGDSRALLATYSQGNVLQARQLTDSHTVDNEIEKNQLILDHPDDPQTVFGGKVKGKLKVTRAFGVGYLKKKHMNDALMGILRVRNLISPPYVSMKPSTYVHEVTNTDQFVVLGSDGLFDFFSNEEVVNLVHKYISSNPCGDPSKHLVQELLIRAADCAGFTVEELMNIPAGRRRKYHDDVTVIVIILGTFKRTTKASVYL